MYSLTCPLCLLKFESVNVFFQDKKRSYHQCPQCSLVFVHPDERLTPEQELKEYRLHENHIDDEGYRKFLNRALTPLLSTIDSFTNALDFGCGPGPLLAMMLKEHGLQTSIYDPFFFPSRDVLDKTYSLITCTEAIEHFHYPHKEWSLWQSLIKSGGVILVMTKRVINQERFKQWHYKNDPTHVCFFSEDTFRYLGQKYQYDVQFPTNDVVLMKKL